jgi:hypothetical protein
MIIDVGHQQNRASARLVAANPAARQHLGHVGKSKPECVPGPIEAARNVLLSQVT